MPNKTKFRKNRKLKSKMKGGNAEGPGKEADQLLQKQLPGSKTHNLVRELRVEVLKVTIMEL